ncbi:hypothetical protein CS063_16135 [Sporanaerobium hydrogeniformans]|uniref:Uncharacterized protein n=1 Tax=Sporanaerobium hydrogeniformans TaxID=3072179 RepID=A0AC61D9Z2_9FIRM|nr:S-layer homology domain-containing protein [Sporanaerobium hydrogeniformans]PHV69362.1 hypothetical protein CS063_16135 [Sporanaerobium hydrogeniformans]
MYRKRMINLLSIVLIINQLFFCVPYMKANEEYVEHDIATGNLRISDNRTYHVTGTSSSYNIVIETHSSPTVILDNVSLTPTGTSLFNPIRLEGDAKVELELRGENNIVNNTAYSIWAGIRVKGEWTINSKHEISQTTEQMKETAALKIRGSGSLKIINKNYGAGIGGNGTMYQDGRGGEAAGYIVIGDEVRLEIIEEGRGAGIGGGGSMDKENLNTLGGAYGGFLCIEDNASVEITSGISRNGQNVAGASIGGGVRGAGGDITIKGNAEVRITSHYTGAGIGGGSHNDNNACTIYIGESAKVKVTATHMGAAIGGGSSGTSGKIKIVGDTQVEAVTNGSGAAIGGGYNGVANQIVLKERTKVKAISTSMGPCIGGGSVVNLDTGLNENSFGCRILSNLFIEEEAQLTLEATGRGAAVGMISFYSCFDIKGGTIKMSSQQQGAIRKENIFNKAFKDFALQGGSVSVNPPNKDSVVYRDEKVAFPLIIETRFKNKRINYSLREGESLYVYTDELGRFYPWLPEGDYKLKVNSEDHEDVYVIVVNKDRSYHVTLSEPPKCLCSTIAINFEGGQIELGKDGEAVEIPLLGEAMISLNDCPYHLEDKFVISYVIDKDYANTANAYIVSEGVDKLKVTTPGEVKVKLIANQEGREESVEKGEIFNVILPDIPQEGQCLCEKPKLHLNRDVIWLEGKEWGVYNLQGEVIPQLNGCALHENPQTKIVYELEEDAPNTALAILKENNQIQVKQAGIFTLKVTGMEEKSGKQVIEKWIYKVEEKKGSTEEPTAPKEEPPSQEEPPIPKEEPPSQEEPPIPKEEPSSQEEPTIPKEEPSSQEEPSIPKEEPPSQKELTKPNKDPLIQEDKQFYFKDIESHWAKEAIYFVITKGFLKEGNKEYFYPNAPISRQVGLDVIDSLNTYGIPKEEGYKSHEIVSIKYEGLEQYDSTLGKVGVERFLGEEKERILPIKESFMTREEMVGLLYDYTLYSNQALLATEDELPFKDKADISKDKEKAIRAFWCAGIIRGRGQSIFAPKENLTRAEFAKLLQNYIYFQENTSVNNF